MTEATDLPKTLAGVSSEFDDMLAMTSHSQNHEKQKHVPWVAGAGAHEHTQKLFGKNSGIEGEVVRATICLGPAVNDTGTLVDETPRRVAAMRAGWMSMGRYWTSGVPIRNKRVIFLSRGVQCRPLGHDSFRCEQADL